MLQLTHIEDSFPTHIVYMRINAWGKKMRKRKERGRKGKAVRENSPLSLASAPTTNLT
jgi:hypothetical protein